MDVTLVVSLAFLVSPLMGYIVIILPLTTRQKIVVALVGLVLLITVPLVVLYLAGSANGALGIGHRANVSKVTLVLAE